MKLRIFGLAVLAITASSALTANSATATTFEVGGVGKNEAVTFKTTLKVGFVISLTDTGGFFTNSCTASTIEGTTSTFTGTAVGGPYSAMSFSSCKEEPVVVDSPGSFSVEHISGTTNGTVSSSNAKVTSPSPFGKLTCVTSSTGTDMGKFTGVSSGNATMDLNAVLSCGAITVKLTATFVTTSPAGLGVV
jgi:hypothetical protein